MSIKERRIKKAPPPLRIPPKKGKAHIWNIIRTILNYKPEGRLTDLNLPLEYLLKIQKRKCIAFLLHFPFIFSYLGTKMDAYFLNIEEAPKPQLGARAHHLINQKA